MDNASCPIVAGAPDVMKAAFTKEIDFFADARHRVPRPGARRSPSRRCCKQPACSSVGPAARHHRGRERLRVRRGVEGARHRSTTTCRSKGARHPRDGRGGEPRRHPDDRPPVPLRPGPEPRHPRGVPGARLPDPVDALDPEGPRVARSLLRERHRRRVDRDAARASATCGRRTTRPTRRRRSGRRSSPRATRTSSCSTCRRFKCGHDAPTYGLIDSIIASAATPYSALHDIDANKPGGSIKIRVKTYAHALKLHEERLEDTAQAKRRARSTASTEKRLELLELKQQQLEARKQQDPALEAQIDELDARRSRAYSAGRSRPPKINADSRPRTRAWCGSESRSASTTRNRRARLDRDEEIDVETATATRPARRKDCRIARRRGQSADIDVDAELKKFELEQSASASASRPATEHWRDDIPDRRSPASQRAHTTLLVSGLTMAHDLFVQGALRGIGYKVQRDRRARQRRAPVRQGVRQPRPVQPDLLHRRQPGEVPRRPARRAEACRSKDIVKNYVFLTAGACGPCRFGTYVTEYRKALRDAGFDGFRVMLFQQTGGLKQATGEERRARDEPDVLHRRSSRRSSSATCSTRSATASAPTRWSRARPTARSRASKKLIYEAFDDRRRTSLLWRCCQARRNLDERQGRPHAASSRRCRSSASSGR